MEDLRGDLIFALRTLALLVQERRAPGTPALADGLLERAEELEGRATGNPDGPSPYDAGVGKVG